jgi:hypothetical protein
MSSPFRDGQRELRRARGSPEFQIRSFSLDRASLNVNDSQGAQCRADLFDLGIGHFGIHWQT